MKAALDQAAGLSYNAKSGKVVWALGGLGNLGGVRQSSYTAFTPELASARLLLQLL